MTTTPGRRRTLSSFTRLPLPVLLYPVLLYRQLLGSSPAMLERLRTASEARPPEPSAVLHAGGVL
jgi:hypothetical protein